MFDQSHYETAPLIRWNRLIALALVTVLVSLVMWALMIALIAAAPTLVTWAGLRLS